MRKLPGLWSIISASLVLLPACYVPPPIYVVEGPPEPRPLPGPPPAPRIEEPTPPPDAGAVWQQGYWHYDLGDADYHWVEGRWVEPQPELEYVAVNYFVDAGRWYYRPCYWRPRHWRPHHRRTHHRHRRADHGARPMHTAAVPHDRDHRVAGWQSGPRVPAPAAEDHRVRRPAPAAEDHRVRRPAPPIDDGTRRIAPPPRRPPRTTIVLRHATPRYRTDRTGAIVLAPAGAGRPGPVVRRPGPLGRRPRGVMTVTLPRRSQQRPSLRDQGSGNRPGWRPPTLRQPRPVVSTTPPRRAVRRPPPRVISRARPMSRTASRIAAPATIQRRAPSVRQPNPSVIRQPRVVLGPVRRATPRAIPRSVAPPARRFNAPNTAHGGLARRSSSSSKSASTSTSSKTDSRRRGASAAVKRSLPSRRR